MASHENFDHEQQDKLRRIFEEGERTKRDTRRPEFYRRLEERAAELSATGGNSITADGPSITEWRAPNGVAVAQLSPDEQDILRISVGGLIHAGQYCRFRGDRAKCIHVLRLALAALETPPPQTWALTYMTHHRSDNRDD